MAGPEPDVRDLLGVRICRTGFDSRPAPCGILCDCGLDRLSARRGIRDEPGCYVRRRGCRLSFSAEPAVSDHLPRGRCDHGDDGVAQVAVAATAAFPDLGELPWRILHGLAGLRRVLRRGADPALAWTARS